jgi:hypothetical protein
MRVIFLNFSLSRPSQSAGRLREEGLSVLHTGEGALADRSTGIPAEQAEAPISELL